MNKNIQKSKSKIMDRHLFYSVLKYAKYCSILSGSVSKIFREKVKVLRSIDAISTGIFEICDFINESSILSSYNDLVKIDSVTTSLVELMIDHFDKTFIKTAQNYNYYEAKMGNSIILIAVNSYYSETQSVYCNKNEVLNVKKEISKLFWKTYSNNIIMGYTKEQRKYEDGETLFVKPDTLDFDENSCSDEFNEIFSYINKFFIKDKHRAIVFYGNPGVGKSTIIKQIAAKLKTRTIRISLSSFIDFDINSIFDLMNSLNPDCLIIDDFDRVEMSANMLPIFENLHKQIKLIMISVNKLNYFDKNKGLIRPERFDKLVKINNLNDEIIEKILGEKNDILIAKVKMWPAAFIKELKENIDILGKEDTDKYVKELQERVDYQNKEEGVSGGKKEEADAEE